MIRGYHGGNFVICPHCIEQAEQEAELHAVVLEADDNKELLIPSGTQCTRCGSVFIKTDWIAL